MATATILPALSEPAAMRMKTSCATDKGGLPTPRRSWPASRRVMERRAAPRVLATQPLCV